MAWASARECHSTRTAFKAPGLAVDGSSVVVLFAVAAALLGACGLGLATLGIAMLAEGNGAAVVLVICGVSICYGAYLFGRAAVRVRRDLREHPLSEQQEASRHRKVHYYLGYTAMMTVGAVVLPAPTVVRVLMPVSALLVLPLLLAREFEPRRKRRPSGD